MNAMTDLGLYRHLDEMAPWNDRLQVLEVHRRQRRGA